MDTRVREGSRCRFHVIKITGWKATSGGRNTVIFFKITGRPPSPLAYRFGGLLGGSHCRYRGSEKSKGGPRAGGAPIEGTRTRLGATRSHRGDDSEHTDGGTASGRTEGQQGTEGEAGLRETLVRNAAGNSLAIGMEGDEHATVGVRMGNREGAGNKGCRNSPSAWRQAGKRGRQGQGGRSSIRWRGWGLGPQHVPREGASSSQADRGKEKGEVKSR